MRKSSQLYMSVIVFTAITGVGIAAFVHQKNLLAFWLIGIMIGFVLYRSGICFSSMFHDIFLFRDFSMARAVLLIIIVSLIGIGVFQLHEYVNSGTIPGRFHSVGVHTAVGGFLFGIGMILAGGCAVGTLQRIGEGFLLFWLVLLGIISGSVMGVFNYSWWIHSFFSHRPVFLPDVLGWFNAGLAALLILIAMYYWTFVLEKKSFKVAKGCNLWQKKS